LAASALAEPARQRAFGLRAESPIAIELSYPPDLNTTVGLCRRRLISGEQLRNAFRGFHVTDGALESNHDRWVELFPCSYVAHLACGIYFKKVGQARRGDDFIDKTGVAQLIAMGAAYRNTEEDFHASAGLSRKPLRCPWLHDVHRIEPCLGR
jgi:hypothetical protein